MNTPLGLEILTKDESRFQESEHGASILVHSHGRSARLEGEGNRSSIQDDRVESNGDAHLPAGTVHVLHLRQVTVNHRTGRDHFAVGSIRRIPDGSDASAHHIEVVTPSALQQNGHQTRGN